MDNEKVTLTDVSIPFQRIVIVQLQWAVAGVIVSAIIGIPVLILAVIFFAVTGTEPA